MTFLHNNLENNLVVYFTNEQKNNQKKKTIFFFQLNYYVSILSILYIITSLVNKGYTRERGSFSVMGEMTLKYVLVNVILFLFSIFHYVNSTKIIVIIVIIEKSLLVLYSRNKNELMLVLFPNAFFIILLCLFTDIFNITIQNCCSDPSFTIFKSITRIQYLHS